MDNRRRSFSLSFTPFLLGSRSDSTATYLQSALRIAHYDRVIRKTRLRIYVNRYQLFSHRLGHNTYVTDVPPPQHYILGSVHVVHDVVVSMLSTRNVRQISDGPLPRIDQRSRALVGVSEHGSFRFQIDGALCPENEREYKTVCVRGNNAKKVKQIVRNYGKPGLFGLLNCAGFVPREFRK